MFLEVLPLLVPAVPAADLTPPAAPTQVVQAAAPALEASEDDGRGTPYRVDKDDNICGLDQPRQLSKPAKVDYKALMDITPEVKEINDRNIDPNSAKGIELMSKARRRVLTACETVRGNKGYCSVWKKITRRDGKTIPDCTAAVKGEIKAGK